MKKKLIIFTRFPVPGRAKTRLIPVLGKEGAADLQRRMTEQTLETAEKLANNEQLRLEIHYADGSPEQMRKWLGQNRIYCEQTSGDLGKKLSRAFTKAFHEGYQQVMIIGADCPTVSTRILATGFSKLCDHDLVLGPATDGGYYLIGLRQPYPELFITRSWGSNLLLAETVDVAKNLALKLYLLEELTDVDRPEDLKDLGNYSDPE